MRFLVWGVPCGFQTTNFIWGFQCCIWYIAPWLGLLQFQSIQPTRQDFANDFKCNPLLRWMIMPCVSKPSCTKFQDQVSLWLICYIQCQFSVSYLSIPGIVAHNRCSIFHIFTFSFRFQSPMSFYAISNVQCRNCFSGGFKTGQRGKKVDKQGCGFIIICFKILACLISRTMGWVF